VSQTTELVKRRDETSIFLQQTDQTAQYAAQAFSVSKSQAQMIPVDKISINGKPDQFLNLPKMESSDLKTLYKEFSVRKILQM